jgi:hypothetical protein
MSNFLNLQTKCKEFIRKKNPSWSSGSFIPYIVIPSEGGNWIDFDSNPRNFAKQTLLNMNGSFEKIETEITKTWDERTRTLKLPKVLYENTEKKEDLAKIIKNIVKNKNNLHNKCLEFIKKDYSSENLPSSTELNIGIDLVIEIVKAGEKGVGKFSDKIIPDIENIARKNIEKLSAVKQCEVFYRDIFGLSMETDGDGQLFWKFEEKKNTLIFNILNLTQDQQKTIKEIISKLNNNFVECYACHTQLYSMAYLKKLKKEHPGNFNADHYAYWNAMDCEHKLAFLISQLFYTLQLNRGEKYRDGTFEYKTQIAFLMHIIASILEYAGCCKKCNIRKSSINCNKKSLWDAVKNVIKRDNPAFESDDDDLKAMDDALDKVYEKEFQMLNDEVKKEYPFLAEIMYSDIYTKPNIPDDKKIYVLNNIYKIISKCHLIYTENVIIDLVKAHAIGNQIDYGSQIATIQEGITTEWRDILLAIENHTSNLEKKELELIINNYKDFSIYIISNGKPKNTGRTSTRFTTQQEDVFNNLRTKFINSLNKEQWVYFANNPLFIRIQSMERYVESKYGQLSVEKYTRWSNLQPGLSLSNLKATRKRDKNRVLNEGELSEIIINIKLWENVNAAFIANANANFNVPVQPPNFISPELTSIYQNKERATAALAAVNKDINEEKMKNEISKKTLLSRIKTGYNNIKTNIRKNIKRKIKNSNWNFMDLLCGGLGVLPTSSSNGGERKKRGFKKYGKKPTPLKKQNKKVKKMLDKKRTERTKALNLKRYVKDIMNAIIIDDIFGIGTYEYELSNLLNELNRYIHPNINNLEELTLFLNTPNNFPRMQQLISYLVNNNIYRKQYYPFEINHQKNYEYLPAKPISGRFIEDATQNYIGIKSYSNSNGTYDEDFLNYISLLSDNRNIAWGEITPHLGNIHVTLVNGGNQMTLQEIINNSGKLNDSMEIDDDGADEDNEVNYSLGGSKSREKQSYSNNNSGKISNSKNEMIFKDKNNELISSNVLKKYNYNLKNFLYILATYFIPEDEEEEEEENSEDFFSIVKEILEELPSIPEIYSKTLDIGLKYYIDGEELQRKETIESSLASPMKLESLTPDTAKMVSLENQQLVENDFKKEDAFALAENAAQLAISSSKATTEAAEALQNAVTVLSSPKTISLSAKSAPIESSKYIEKPLKGDILDSPKTISLSAKSAPIESSKYIEKPLKGDILDFTKKISPSAPIEDSNSNLDPFKPSIEAWNEFRIAAGGKKKTKRKKKRRKHTRLKKRKLKKIIKKKTKRKKKRKKKKTKRKKKIKRKK